MGAVFRPGDPIGILELLCDMGLTVTYDRPTGELHVRPRPVPALARELIVANRALIRAVFYGAEPVGYRRRVDGKVKVTRVAHVWARCDRCGAGMMRPKGAKPRGCAFTPGCQGRHVPVSLP